MSASLGGRPKIDIDTNVLLDLLERGERPASIADELGCSTPTIKKRIAEIQDKQGVLLQYRNLQALHLTELQIRVLEAITPDKIEEAPLRDLVACFKILKDKELIMDGKPSEIKGLVAHLIQMEKMERSLTSGNSDLIDKTIDLDQIPYSDARYGENGVLPEGKFDSLSALDDATNELE